jgi:outer membrane protein OmpA-like peptidoglycan-associated protein
MMDCAGLPGPPRGALVGHGEEGTTMQMMTRKAALRTMAAVMLVIPSMALSAEATLKGLIIAHEDSTIVVRVGATDTPVLLTEATKIRGVTGALGVRGEDHPPHDLIRGLAVEVTTVQNGADLLATDVTFKNSDLKTARQIQAGLHGTEERIDNVGDLVPAGRTKVFFAVGSAVISAKGKEDLKAIAEQAKTMKGYRLAVVGRADPSGDAAANKKLSERRAAAVTDYLLQSCGVLPGRILPTAAVGESEVAQDLDPPKTAEEARRVTVTIAVSKSAVRR